MSDPETLKSALVILVPEAEALVRPLRLQFDVSAQSGLAAHVTVLFPFRATDHLSSVEATRLRTIFARHRPFSFSLGDVQRFPGVVYLAVEPAGPCSALTRATVEAFPDCQPYGGAFSEPVPHLTIGQGLSPEASEVVSGELQRLMAATGPIVCQVREVAWVFKRRGRWSVGDRFPLLVDAV